MEFLNKISFYNPEYLLLLILVISHLIWFFILKKNRVSTILFSELNFLSNKKTIKERLVYTPYILQILSICFIIISLSRPQTSTSWEESKTEGIDIIIAMDVSGSMLAQDLKPNRLESSKKIAIDFIRQRKNDRIGLVVFSGESFTQCPLTTDHNSLIN